MRCKAIISSMALVLAAPLLTSCSVEWTTSNDSVAKQVSSAISERAGVSIEVTCPGLAPDRTNECQARAETGETFTVEVKKDTGDDWGWTTRDVAFGGAVSEKIAFLISERAGVPVAVTCPAFPFGKTCQARAETGETFPVEVKQSTGQTFYWEAKGATFGKAVAERITKLYAEAHQIQLPGLTCTGIILEGSTEPATCQAHVQDVTVVFDIKAESDGVSVTARRGFVPLELPAQLAVGEMARLGIEAKVDCGPVPRVSVPNSQFTCTARDASGDTQLVYYRVTGNNGALEMQGTPFRWP